MRRLLVCLMLAPGCADDAGGSDTEGSTGGTATGSGSTSGENTSGDPETGDPKYIRLVMKFVDADHHEFEYYWSGTDQPEALIMSFSFTRKETK